MNPPDPAPFRVEFSAAAWSQAGRLDGVTFATLRGALDALALRAAEAPEQPSEHHVGNLPDDGPEAPPTIRTRLQAVEVVYRVDRARRVVELLLIGGAAR